MKKIQYFLKVFLLKYFWTTFISEWSNDTLFRIFTSRSDSAFLIPKSNWLENCEINLLFYSQKEILGIWWLIETLEIR